MSTLEQLRAQLAGELDGQGITPVTFVPERPQPPLAVIAPGSPYVQQGDTFGVYKVAFDIVLMTPKATNEAETIDLDAMIAMTVGAIAESQTFYLSQIGQPIYGELRSTTCYTVVIEVFAYDDLEGA